MYMSNLFRNFAAQNCLSMKKIFFLVVLFLGSRCYIEAQSGNYDIIGIWQVVNSSSGNDLGYSFSEDMNWVWLWTFQLGGVLVMDETDDGGGIHNTTYSLNGNVLRIENSDYKIISYTPNTMTIRYDSEYVEYQGQQIHDWLIYTLEKIGDTRVETVNVAYKSSKTIVSGQLLIERNGKSFNVSGVQVK